MDFIKQCKFKCWVIEKKEEIKNSFYKLMNQMKKI